MFVCTDLLFARLFNVVTSVASKEAEQLSKNANSWITANHSVSKQIQALGSAPGMQCLGLNSLNLFLQPFTFACHITCAIVAVADIANEGRLISRRC
jgi:hypothetical protein